MVSQTKVIEEINVLKLEINKLNIKQNEVLVMKVPEDTTSFVVDNLMQVLTEVLPPNTRCFVFRGELEISVILNKGVRND